MKNLLLIIVMTISVFGWEINTHRAIDRKAIEESKVNGNLKLFIENSKIPTDDTYYNGEEFEDYGITYLDYIENNKTGETNGVAQWHQVFEDKPSWQNMIEAGTILEDAQWPHWEIWEHIPVVDNYDKGDGRFNNHFADPQHNYSGLWLNNVIGYMANGGGMAGIIVAMNTGKITSALHWATDATLNKYDYKDALEYFKKGFNSNSKTDRRKYQAKMLVSVGHILHLVNDMNVPAHTRNDAHPNGDALEWWAQGGEFADTKGMGFYIDGNRIKNNIVDLKKEEPYKYGELHKVAKEWQLYEYMVKEAKFTGTHFFSGYATNSWYDMDTIEKKRTSKQLL